VPQPESTPDRLAAEIASLPGDPARIAGMAPGAKAAGVLDAADQLAELVIRTAGLKR
jgi:UDP-N-acetylglucosamine--N-acetylmuramyl-(pentapeptide) pyrophosphoryl-undecaprenol N-acetylglucosamine transferase